MTKEEAITMVRRNGANLDFIPVELQMQYPEICIEAVRSARGLAFVPKEVQKEHPEIYLEAVQQYGWLLAFVPKEVQKEHPEICLEVVKQSGYSLKYVLGEVQKEYPEICLEAVKQSGYSLKYVPGEVQKEYPEICLEAVKKYGKALEYVPEEVQKEHPEICLEAVKKYGKALEYVPEEVQKEHPEICLEAEKYNGEALEYVPEELDENNPEKYLEMYFEAVEYNGEALENVPEEVQKEHPEICSVALENYEYAVEEVYRYVSAEVQKMYPLICIGVLADYEPHEEFINIFQYVPEEVQKEYPRISAMAVDADGSALKYVPEEVKKQHPEMCLEAVKQYGYLLEYVPKEVIKEHPDICLVAVKKKGSALEYVPEEVRKEHPEIYLEAVKRDGGALEHVPEEVRKEHPEICLEAVKRYGGALKHVPKEVIKEHPDICLVVVKESYWGLEYVPEELYEDNPEKYLEMCLLAVKKKGSALEYVPEEVIKEHPEIYLEAVKRDGGALEYVPEEVRKEHPEIYLEAVKRDGGALEHIPKEVRKEHPEICLEAVKRYGGALEHVPKEVRKEHPEICLEAVKQYGYLLEYVPEEVRREKPEIYIEAAKRNGNMLSYVSEELQKEHPEICMEALKQDSEGSCYHASKYISKSLIDRVELGKGRFMDNIKAEYLIKALAIDGMYLKFASPEQKKNLEIVLAAVQQEPGAFMYVDPEIRDQVRKILQEKQNTGPEWQDKCLEEIKDSDCVILSSPTGSGKTRVFLEWAKQKEERPIYITAPIKALSNQRYRELVEQGYVVGLETGDIKNVPENCDFVCCTQEIYTNKYAEDSSATLIMDEFHYIFENPDRARTYIDALQNSKVKNILLCSATLGDMEKLKQYIEKVSRREFKAYENQDRLTTLTYEGYMPRRDIKDALVVTFSRKNIESIVSKLVWSREKYRDEEEICRIEELAQKYKIEDGNISLYDIKKGVAGYYGGLLPKEKLFIEECFEKRLIDTVVGTDALAMGVNFPVENVVFAQLAKYYDGPISKNLFEQIAGRAGRKGYFDEGKVWYCDDFTNDRGYPVEARDYETTQLFERMLLKENESVSINLQPNIRAILRGEVSIEEEAEYIVKYSIGGNKEAVEKEIYKIEQTIEQIQQHDFVEEIFKEEFGDYEEVDVYYYDEEKKKIEIDLELEQEIEDIKRQIMSLKEEFDAHIADVYFDEYSAEENCKLFAHILVGKSTEELIELHGESFAEMLQLRKYLRKLPKQYRKSHDLKMLEEQINEIDDTALNLDRGGVSVSDIAKGTKQEQLDSQAMTEILETMGEQCGELGEQKQADGEEFGEDE